MGDDATEQNRLAFSDAATVADYAPVVALSPAEDELFDEFVPPGAAVLDLGVGTGRTTPRLARDASRYVGLDIAEPMVEAARRLHPGHDLRVGDASDLSAFGDDEFDVVVFSYNGIDYLHPDSARRTCLAEVARVVRPGGAFVFSTHDPRCLLRPPTRPLTARSVAVAGYQTARRLTERLPSTALRRGEGYVVDKVRGGLVTHMATPDRVRAEVEPAGFLHRRTLAAQHPAEGRWTTGWWYYAFERASAPDAATSA